MAPEPAFASTFPEGSKFYDVEDLPWVETPSGEYFIVRGGVALPRDAFKAEDRIWRSGVPIPPDGFDALVNSS